MASVVPGMSAEEGKPMVREGPLQADEWMRAVRALTTETLNAERS